MVIGPETSRLHRFEFSVISKNRHIGSITGYILDVCVIHQNVHLAVTNQVSAQIIKNLRFRFLVNLHTVRFDDLIHGSSQISFRICIDFFNVGGQRADKYVHNFVAVLLFLLGHWWFDDLVNDV